MHIKNFITNIMTVPENKTVFVTYCIKKHNQKTNKILCVFNLENRSNYLKVNSYHQPKICRQYFTTIVHF